MTIIQPIAPVKSWTWIRRS